MNGLYQRIHVSIPKLSLRILHVLNHNVKYLAKVSVGSIVVVFNKTRNIESTYHIVGSYETDPRSGKISDSSPIGIALLGAKEGDEVVVTGAREQTLVVKSVSRAKD